MNRTVLVLPLAAAFVLTLAACGRDENSTTASNPELPRTAQAPGSADRPAAGTLLNPDTSDPSIPSNPANTDPGKKDRSPAYSTGESSTSSGG